MPTKEKLAKETPEQREKRLEYNRNYNKINSEKINQANSEYHKNSQHYKDYIKIQIPCECGGLINFYHKKRHNKTIQHSKWLENQPQIIC